MRQHTEKTTQLDAKKITDGSISLPYGAAYNLFCNWSIRNMYDAKAPVDGTGEFWIFLLKIVNKAADQS